MPDQPVSPDDEPTEDSPYSIWVQQHLAGEISLTEAQAKIIEYVIKNYKPKSRGNYTSMVRRETDGPDPLVQEPKGKP